MSEQIPESFTKDQLKAAFKAFKKRLKLTRLDEESKLNYGPLSSTRASIVAIAPPHEYPVAIWDELVKQGKLKRAERGTYEIAEE